MHILCTAESLSHMFKPAFMASLSLSSCRKKHQDHNFVTLLLWQAGHRCGMALSWGSWCEGRFTWYCVGRCPCPWLGVGTKRSVRTLSAQIILWFCVTCRVETKNITKPLSWRAWKFSGESWSYLLPGKRSWGRFSYELCELWEPPDKNPALASLPLFHFRRDTNILPGFPLLSWSYLPFAS